MKILILLLFGFVSGVMASEEAVHIAKVNNQLCDKASLQRGAQLYMNYCAGCHSLQYVRFKEMAHDLGIVDNEGNVLEKLVNDNLNFLSDKINDPIHTAMPSSEAKQWFGIAPPDLSLVARSRGTNWIYSYLRSFYVDPKKPWGVNNVVFPDVAMPHVLSELQGVQTPVFKKATIVDDLGNSTEKTIISHLELTKPGKLTPKEYDQAITDLVNFLEYVGEPHKLQRERLGVWVILFLVVLTLFAYLLKREYWKDVH